jgi:hypothetical protein
MRDKKKKHQKRIKTQNLKPNNDAKGRENHILGPKANPLSPLSAGRGGGAGKVS